MAATTRPTSAADEELKLETDVAEATGVVSPVSWWLIALVGLLAVAVVLFALQVLGGNQGTAMVPGTPIAAPQSSR